MNELKSTSGEVRSEPRQPHRRARTEPSVVVSNALTPSSELETSPWRKEESHRLLAREKQVALDEATITQRIPAGRLAELIEAATPSADWAVTADSLTDIQIAAWHSRGGVWTTALDASPLLLQRANDDGTYYPPPTHERMMAAREEIALEINWGAPDVG